MINVKCKKCGTERWMLSATTNRKGILCTAQQKATGECAESTQWKPIKTAPKDGSKGRRCRSVQLEDEMENWIVGQPGGPAGPFYSVVTSSGRVIAMQILDKRMAKLIAQLPQLKELRYDWAGIISRLANIALDGASSNDRDYAEDMIQMVLLYLEGAAECED